MSERDAILQVARCPRCDHTMWPVAPHCPCCLAETVPYDLPPYGTILEYSHDTGSYFCIAEFEHGIRLMCELDVDREPISGQRIILDRVARSGAGYAFIAVYARPDPGAQNNE